MRFLFTGDLVVDQSYSPLENIDENLINLFASSDCNVVNLEAPTTGAEAASKIIKTGPHLKSNIKSTTDVMKVLNVHIASLANNHIKDYGERGVLDTIDFCNDLGVVPLGAGSNLEEASLYHVLQANGASIAIVSIAENEWSSATATSAGANGMNFIKDIRQIQKAKKEHDFVFVIVHGGHEYYSLPSPRMKEQYRFYVEQGADLVVGHHTHCISGFEIYRDAPIYYSLGNFLFTKNSSNAVWYNGLVLDVAIQNRKLVTCVHPVKQEADSFRLSLLEGADRDKVIELIQDYSLLIEDDVLLEKNWISFVTKRKKAYLNYWSPKTFIQNRILLALLNKLPFRFTNLKGLSYYLNLMRCEAHHDLSQAVLKEELDQ